MSLNFKTLVLSLFVLTAVTSKAQDLTFSRVIDTLITLEVGEEYVNVTNGLIGDVITPPVGKVWKVNNIQSPGAYSIPSGGYLGIAPRCLLSLVLPSGVVHLDAASFNVTGTGVVPVIGNITNVNFPLWLNEGVTLQISLAPQYEYHTEPITTQVRNISCFALISILEFDI